MIAIQLLGRLLTLLGAVGLVAFLRLVGEFLLFVGQLARGLSERGSIGFLRVSLLGIGFRLFQFGGQTIEFVGGEFLLLLSFVEIPFLQCGGGIAERFGIHRFD